MNPNKIPVPTIWQIKSNRGSNNGFYDFLQGNSWSNRANIYGDSRVKYFVSYHLSVKSQAERTDCEHFCFPTILLNFLRFRKPCPLYVLDEQCAIQLFSKTQLKQLYLVQFPGRLQIMFSNFSKNKNTMCTIFDGFQPR